jgi:hypothetical protein
MSHVVKRKRVELNEGLGPKHVRNILSLLTSLRAAMRFVAFMSLLLVQPSKLKMEISTRKWSNFQEAEPAHSARRYL